MKKPLLLVLTAMLLLSSFASCSSCSRRDQYEDQLESQKEAESGALIPQPGADGVANIIGTNASDYALAVIKKTSDKGYFAGNTEAQLTEKYKNNAYQFAGNRYLPTGRVIGAGNGQNYFYNKLTGNISEWCPDPLCEHGEDCIWNHGWTADPMLFVGEDHVYFLSNYNDFTLRLYRCDFQRNNVEMILDNALDIYNIWYEKDNVLYYEQFVYASEGAAAVNMLMALDIQTGETKAVSDPKKDMFIQAIIRDTVYFSYESDPKTVYKTDLSFSDPQKLWENAGFESYNDKYILTRGNKDENGKYAFSVYHIDSGKTYSLGSLTGNPVLSGDYVYYTQELSDKEIANDPHKDYYTWTWDNEDVFIDQGGGYGIIEKGEKGLTARTRPAGRIFRMKTDGTEKECVLQLTYKGVPVRIDSWSVDGECIWFTYNHYDEFKNYYNQDYGSDKQTQIKPSDAEPRHLAMADLQSGILRVIELEEEGCEGLW